MTNTPTEPIPTDREAMQQALEALEEATTFTGAWPDGRKAITALRAALAQPQQEAVFIQSDHLQKARQAPFLCRVEPTQRLPDFVPLYDHRPASPAPWELDLIPTSWELSFGNGHTDEEKRPEWRVHERRGSINDREWDLLGTGATPSAALSAARARNTALTKEHK